MNIEKKIMEEKNFQQKIAVIRFIIANMSKIVIEKDIIPITDVIEGPNKHPHYHSRITTMLFYDEEKECLVHRESRSGSPNANNFYDVEVTNIFDLAGWIVDDINTTINISDDENRCEYMEIEGF